MPRIEFVNLSLNRLQTPILEPPPCPMTNLRSLVLNNTKLNWFSVEELLRLLPSLEELHLSLNEYTNVLLDTVEDEDQGNNSSKSSSMSSDDCNCDDETPSSLGSEGKVVATINVIRYLFNCFINQGSPCCNGYRKTTIAHEGVRKLHLNGNPISDWLEICRLGRIFPHLESLVLADCPLR